MSYGIRKTPLAPRHFPPLPLGSARRSPGPTPALPGRSTPADQVECDWRSLVSMGRTPTARTGYLASEKGAPHASTCFPIVLLASAAGGCHRARGGVAFP